MDTSLPENNVGPLVYHDCLHRPSYALPALSDSEQDVLVRWLDAGAPYNSKVIATPEFKNTLQRWETFFNRDSVKDALFHVIFSNIGILRICTFRIYLPIPFFSSIR